MISLPDSFSKRIIHTFGEPGETWLDNLPEMLVQITERWSLSLGQPFAEMSYNYVTRAQLNDGTPIVLKVGVPNPELTTEIAALQHFDGRGAVKLLQADPAIGALLLERVEPGSPILDLDDDQRETSIATQVIEELHHPVSANAPFPTIDDWGQGLDRLRSTFKGGTGPFPALMVERAEEILRTLSASQGEQVLLHGDLHHWNIISSQRSGWLAIDPKGLIGEREYEAGAWLRNPIPALLDWSRKQRAIRRRIDQFTDRLGLDRQRVLAWSQYQAVLAAWWSYEETNPKWQQMLAIAELLLSVD